VLGPAPLPERPPTIAWRGGIDLNPLDVTDDDQMAWLATLVWPEHDDRRTRLLAAIGVARADPPVIVRGDLVEELPRMVDEASAYAPVVVFHSAVIAYLPEERREAFHELMAGMVADRRCHWVSNEGPRVLPRVTATGPEHPEDEHGFVLGVDGRAVGRTHGHGRTLLWF
jgi:hypothetical protein